ncbi:MAG: zinc dependent phospholipase C family protein [Eubacteriales bacterium]|nr:zinc dependent phospholipase C family protein [Eubacteriales bacterium]
MRKKSHILLARCIADELFVSESLQSHRKAFCLGNVLPDIRPSFITKRHEYFGTFYEVQDKIRELVENGPEVINERVFWRRLGEVLHYIADYFTFPHNRTYTGTLREHNHYEKVLKNNLKAYIQSGEAHIYMNSTLRFGSLPELIEYVQEKHAVYMEKIRNISDDIQYILSVCYQVVQGMLQLCAGRQGACAAWAM